MLARPIYRPGSIPSWHTPTRTRATIPIGRRDLSVVEFGRDVSVCRSCGAVLDSGERDLCAGCFDRFFPPVPARGVVAWFLLGYRSLRRVRAVLARVVREGTGGREGYNRAFLRGARPSLRR